MNVNWTKKEFEIYVLLYAAHCNGIEAKEETNYILSRVEEAVYNKIHTEIVLDIETERVKKIKQYLQVNQYSEKEKKELIKNSKEVFFADNTVDNSEKRMFAFLQKILS